MVDSNTGLELKLRFLLFFQAVTKAMNEKNWELAVMLRGKSFQRNLDTYRMLTRLKPPEKEIKDVTGWNLAVMHIGAPCCGMNAAVRSFTRNCIYSGNLRCANIYLNSLINYFWSYSAFLCDLVAGKLYQVLVYLLISWWGMGSSLGPKLSNKNQLFRASLSVPVPK